MIVFPMELSGRDVNRRTFYLQGVCRSLAFRDVYYSMHVERYFLRSRRPVFIAEAVNVFPIKGGVEAVIARGDGSLVNEEVLARVLYLQEAIVSL